MNGDGFADVIVGAPSFDGNQFDQGRVFVYLGSASGLSSMPAWIADGQIRSGFLGYSVASAGDVNGNGFGDVIIGANGYYRGDHAFVYNGSATGLSSVPSWAAGHDQPINSGFGSSLGGAGDVNHDGYGDVIVGAPSYPDPLAQMGRVFEYDGSAAGLSTSPSWTVGGHQVFSEFANSVGTAGDVNGDGFDDVIVGALYYDHGQNDEGAAFVFRGSPCGLSTGGQMSESDQADARYGVSVGTAGDVNGDGFGDVIIGADHYSVLRPDVGAAFVRFGLATGDTRLHHRENRGSHPAC